MKTNSAIIAGIDFSDSSPLVLRHAVHAAELAGSPLIAVHVIPSGGLADRLIFRLAVESAAELEAAGLEKLRALVAGLPASEKIRLKVCIGRPVDEINRIIKEQDAGLLVIAANDLTKKRLGSIASQCVRTAPCDVLVLRDWQGGDFSKVMVCTDFSRSSGRAVERAARLAKVHQAKLEIVHVIYPPSRDIWGEVLEHPADASLSYVEECRKRSKAQMETFLGAHSECLEGVCHETAILESTLVSTALTHRILDEGADLVVVGTRGHTRIGGLFLGTNAERLLHDVPVSVLAVRGGE